MRGTDDEDEEYRGPSRGELRRDALAVLDLAMRLVAQSQARLHQLPISEDLLSLVFEAQRITPQIAHKRQVHFLAKKMRREPQEVLDGIRAVLDHDKADSRRENATLHRIEALRDRLIADGDAALAELLDQYPQADRQHLRQLARNAREEKLRNKPPHASRELFRALRDLVQGSQPDDASL